ncbi:MAG: OB-fold nucleic acid binding domain-containing protein [Candidatus Hydrothermarchaeales archaeon]
MRMDDSALLRISFAVSTVGLLLLVVVSSQIQATTIKISEIDYDDVGSKVVIEGMISSKRVHEDGHIFLEVEDATGKISVVLFADAARSLGEEELGCLNEGNKVSIAGSVDEYRGTLEVVPRKGEGVKCSIP